MRLFHQLECVGYHRSEASGRGPVLTGRLGKLIPEQSSVAQIVNDAYVREAILNLSATAAAAPARGGPLQDQPPRLRLPPDRRTNVRLVSGVVTSTRREDI